MLLSDPIYQIDKDFVWINLRYYSRKSLRDLDLNSDITAQLSRQPELYNDINTKLILFDSLYEGHGRSDYALASQQFKWINPDRHRWIGNVCDNQQSDDSAMVPGHMVNHCGFLDHVRSLNIDWNQASRSSMLVCLMRRPSPTRKGICKHILECYQYLNPVISYGSLLNYCYYDNELQCQVPILLDGTHSHGNDYHLLTDSRVFDCLINVVAETSDQTYHDGEFGYDTLFVTEKTFKVFAWYQIPVWITVPNFVECIRNMGFDVFDDLVDHSYDNIQDHQQRLQASFASLSKLIQLVQNNGIKNLHNTLMPRFAHNDVVLNRVRRKAKLDYSHGLDKLRETL
jgi:hypothetical protein